jgi:putative hemolysin
VSLAAPLVPYLSVLGGAAEAVAIALVTAILTVVTLVLGELAPKRIAMQRALPWAMIAVGPIDVPCPGSPAPW